MYNIDDISDYSICLISDFAKRYSITNIKAYEYLKQYRAIDFIQDYYDVLHTFSFEQAVEDISKYCAHRGGKLI